MSIPTTKVLETELTEKFFMSVWTPLAESVRKGGLAPKESFFELSQALARSTFMVPSQVETAIKRWSARHAEIWCRQQISGSSLAEQVLSHMAEIKTWVETNERSASLEKMRMYVLIIRLQMAALRNISNLANFQGEQS